MLVFPAQDGALLGSSRGLAGHVSYSLVVCFLLCAVFPTGLKGLCVDMLFVAMHD